MTSNDSGQTDDQELLDRYRRASDTESAAPSDAARAAILAEGRRVAALLAQQKSRHRIDTSQPAANDFRWKIPALGTLGAAVLGALLIAPHYWQTLPGKVATQRPAAPGSAPPASPPTASSMPAAPPPPASAPAPSSNLLSQAPIAPGESLQETVVTQANRERSNPRAEAAAKAGAVPPGDVRLADAASAAQQNYGVAKKYSAPQAPAPADAAPRVRSRNAPTPARLQSAADAGDLAQVSALLDQGAAVNARDAQGRTPLLLAIAQGRVEVVRLLLQRGADPNIADNSGKTPLQLATDQKRQDILALLQNAGAH